MNQEMFSPKKILPIILVLILTAFFASVILKTEKMTVSEEHLETEKTEITKGLHGGKLFQKDGFAVEITIYEEGIPPEFRVFIQDQGKPVNLNAVELSVELKRLQKTDLIRFSKHDDYLVGDQEVSEPHSFLVKIMANYQGKKYEWQYDSFEGRTEIKTEMAKRAGVVIEKAGPIFLKNTLEFSGEIVLNTDRIAHVVPKLPGIVNFIGKNMGEYVQTGELLAVISSRDLAEAKREYLEAVHHHELVKSVYQREESLWQKKLTSEEDYLESKHSLEEAIINNNASRQKLSAFGLTDQEIDLVISSAGKNLARYEIRSPLSGVIIEKDLSLGESVKDDANVFVIADLSTVWASVNIPARDLASVLPGQNLTIHSEELAGETVGKIIFISPLVGEKNRMAKAYVLLNNSRKIWRPGIFIKGKMNSNGIKVPVAVREEALQTFRDWDVVFLNQGNIYQAQPVTLGRKSAGWVEIQSGLEAGMNYVAKNSYVIKADIEKSGASHDH